MKNYVQPGNAIRLIAPTGGVIAGRPYAIGGIVGIASETEIAGGSFDLARDGVYSVDKDASEFAAGDAVYAHSGAATSDTAGDFIGYATETAGTGAETVTVLLVTKAVEGSTPVAAYTEFKASFSQAGTAAPALLEIVNNTIGFVQDGDFGFARSLQGIYSLHFYAGPYLPATAGKCEIVVQAQDPTGSEGRSYTYSANPTGDQLTFSLRDVTGALVDGHGDGATGAYPCFITIRYWE